MRISIVGINYQPERTGVAPYTTGLARHLARDHEVTVLTGVPHYPDWTVPARYRRWRFDEKDAGVRVIRLRHFVPKSQSAVKRATYELTYAARAVAVAYRVPADLVVGVVPALFGAHAALLAARRHRVPYGVIVQDIMSAAAQQGGIQGGSSIASIAARLERIALRGATGLATIHPRMAAQLQQIAGRPDTPAVIYNWTHVQPPTLNHLQARSRFGWRDDQVIALHSGNMGSKQHLEVVVDAARLAQKRQSPVLFVLASDGNQRRALEAYAQGVPNVLFMDGVADADYTNLLASADVLLVNERPGMREMSLPSKVTSYLKAKRPIIAATDEGSSTAEFIAATGGGVITPAGDASAMLAAITALASDACRAAQLAAAGHEFGEKHLAPAGALAAYDAWIDTLMRRGKSR